MAALSVYSDWQIPAGFTAPDEFNASEVAEALIGFLEPFDCPLFPIDDIFNAASDNLFVDPIDNFLAAVPDNLSDADHDSVFAAVPDNPFGTAHDSVFAAVPYNFFGTAHDGVFVADPDNLFGTAHGGVFLAEPDNLFGTDHDSVFAAVPDNLFGTAHDGVFVADPDNFFDAAPENDLLPSRSPPDHCSLHCCAKRHRCCYSAEPQQSLCFESNPFAAEFAPGEPPEPHYFQPTPLAERPEPLPLPQYFEQTPFSAEFTFDPPPKTTAGCGLSAQSVAARVRRKRISDKTQELSRLIPGGGKMNTAEMLQAGHKYVRYLQAQISILGLDTRDKEKCGEEDELLRVLISSAAIQEKLSKQGMCLVPKEMAEAFVADPLLKVNPFMEREINKFSELIGEKTYTN